MRGLIVSAVAIVVLALTGSAAFAEKKYEAPPFVGDCGDSSYKDAKANGITLGISPSPPYSSIDPATNVASGIDVEIHQAVLDWMGVKTIKYEIMPFGQLIPAMISKRIDIVATNIHVTPDRLKVVSFTGPAWWYGPAIIVEKGNPLGIKSLEDLKGKEVGAVAGSAQDEYARHLGATTIPFQTDAEEFPSIVQGRVKIVLEDNVLFYNFIKANPTAPIEIVPNVSLPQELILGYGYGYARYATRKEDCTLRAAYTQGLAELRGDGTVSGILKKYGLDPLSNLIYFQPK
jgi:polar amino acid transport system substrate-binding protein